MLARCRNQGHPCYRNYGGRGIVVCERWHTFDNFLADMGPRPSSKHSLDRIDNNGNYEPGNCRWATRIVQNRNSRHVRLITFNGKTQCLTDWAAETGIGHNAIIGRIDKMGWSVEKALTTPVQDKGYRKQIEFRGESHYLEEWSRLLGIKATTLGMRLKRGLSVEEAFTTQVG